METPGKLGESRVNTLHVHHHGVTGPGGDYQFGVELVAGHRHPLPHEDLVSGATEPHHVDAFGPGPAGLLLQAFLLGHLDDHLGEHGLVAVDHQVHHPFFQYTQVGPDDPGPRGSEEDVLKLGGDEGATPAVGQGTPHPLEEKGERLVVHPHGGAVHDVHHFPVDVAGKDTVEGLAFLKESFFYLFPDLKPGPRGVGLKEGQGRVVLLAKV